MSALVAATDRKVPLSIHMPQQGTKLVSIIGHGETFVQWLARLGHQTAAGS